MSNKSYDINGMKLKRKIGQIYTGTRDYRYKNLVKAYVWGSIPIIIQTDLTQKEFDDFVNRELDISRGKCLVLFI